VMFQLPCSYGLCSSVVTAAAVFLCIVAGCGSSRNPAPKSLEAQDAPFPLKPDTAGARCSNELGPGVESPEIAFRRYAEAINTRRWCDAAGAFEASARIELAEMNFKALTLLAGAANPKREQYGSQLKLFCVRHALSCQDARWVEQATADLMTGTDVTAKLVELRRIATESPAETYSELMRHMSAVDASILSKFDQSLDSVQVTDDTATGEAKQEDGRVSRFNFVKTATGWLLSVH
jgi:hypothetical protein